MTLEIMYVSGVSSALYIYISTKYMDVPILQACSGVELYKLSVQLNGKTVLKKVGHSLVCTYGLAYE